MLPTRFALPPNLMRLLRLALASACVALLTMPLTGCITTAVILANHYADQLPPACSKLSSVERALTSRCGPYQAGSLLAKDVNTTVASACPLSAFANQPALWKGLPELLAKGATPERCTQAPLLAMAKANACPTFSAMDAPTLNAVRWLAVADAGSLSGPVLHMLSCPQAQQAGLDTVVSQWVAQGQLSPAAANFSVLSYVHPSSLSAPWVGALLAAGHQPLRAVEQDAAGFEQALAQGNATALAWWTQRAPSLIHRAPRKGEGHVPWLPLARTMSPGFATDDAARLRSATFLLAQGAKLDASLPHDRGTSVGDYARSVQPQLWPALQALPQRTMPRAAAAAAATANTTLALN
jgi:hypothetical protein